MKHIGSQIFGQISDSDIRQLKIFKVVVDCMGFTAAAAELNVTRSAISSAMSDLESRLGLKLCNRGRSGFSLTEPGRMMYAHTKELLDYLDDFRAKVSLIHSSLTGELSIGVVNNLITSPHMRIVNSLKRLKNEATSVTINMMTMPPNEVERGVLNGQLDIGIIPERQGGHGLDFFEMYSEEFGLYCGQKHPLFNTPDSQITESNLLEYDMVAPSYALTKGDKDLYSRHKVTAKVSDGESIAFLLMTGSFIGFLPSNYANQWVENKIFRRILTENLVYDVNYVAITSVGRCKNPVVDHYLKHLLLTDPND